MIISDKSRRILYISKTYKGKEHDYSLLKKEFPATHQWFEDLEVRLDSGFQGFQDLYVCKKLLMPHKKKRVAKGLSNELTDEQKEYNQLVGRERIVVEHAIGGMKRYRILEHRNRIKNGHTINEVIGVAAALWNFTLNN